MTRRRWSGARTPAALAAALLTLAASPAAQPADSAARLNERAMQLLREGRNEEARDAAERSTKLPAGSAEQLAEAWLHLGTARQRLGDKKGAEEAVGQLAMLLSEVPEGHWLHRETASLRGQLAGKSRDEALREFEGGRAAAPAMENADNPADLGVAMWTMRYSNSVGEFARAVRIGENILSRPGMRPETITDVSLQSYFALRKLGKDAEAKDALERFEAAAPALPEGDTLSLQMQLLRRSLGEDVPAPSGAAYQPEADQFWKLGHPADVGMDVGVLAEIERRCAASGADALLVARGGTIVREWYSPLHRDPVFTMSCVKSIAALVAGLLVEEGKLDIDKPVSAYVPQWNEGLAAKTTVRHVLSMTAGLPKCRDMGVAASGEAGFNAYVSALRPQWEPGTQWAYSNEGAQLLSVIMEKAAGEPVWQYAQRRLFEPMGLRHTALRRDSLGNTNTFADAATTAREMAKFGALVNGLGKLSGKQIVPEAWVRAATTPCPQSGRYGFMWWLHEDPKVWAMEGYLGTAVWAFPELDVVVCRVQSRPYLHATESFDDARLRRLIKQACAKR